MEVPIYIALTSVQILAIGFFVGKVETSIKFIRQEMSEIKDDLRGIKSGK